MKVLTAPEVAEWFQKFSSCGDDRVRYDGDGPFFSHPEATCIDLEYPQKLEQLPFFAHRVATIGYEGQYFRGALIWFTEWGVWNNEEVGYRIVERLRAAAGQLQSFETAPGHLFRADELLDAIGMLLQPMMFGWDAYYLPSWSYGGVDEFFVHISHDSFVSLVIRTRSFYDQAFELLAKGKFNPSPGHRFQTERFCHRT